MIVLNTVDMHQKAHPIACMLLTKGEAADEVSQGLNVRLVRFADARCC